MAGTCHLDVDCPSGDGRRMVGERWHACTRPMPATFGPSQRCAFHLGSRMRTHRAVTRPCLGGALAKWRQLASRQRGFQRRHCSLATRLARSWREKRRGGEKTSSFFVCHHLVHAHAYLGLDLGPAQCFFPFKLCRRIRGDFSASQVAFSSHGVCVRSRPWHWRGSEWG